MKRWKSLGKLKKKYFWSGVYFVELYRREIAESKI